MKNRDGHDGYIRISSLIAIGLLVVVAIVGLWYFLLYDPGKNQAQDTAIVELPTALPIAEPSELPISEPSIEPVMLVSPLPVAEVKPALPRLNESDTALKTNIGDIQGGNEVLPLLVKSELVRKAVRAVHGVSQGFIVQEFRPVQSPQGRFKADKTGAFSANDEALYKMSEANYSRYETHIDSLTSLPPRLVADMYVKYFPLLQQAYEELGLPGPDFYSVTNQAIERLLSVQNIESLSVLRQPSVMYVYDDTAIESKSGVEKLLIRMGEENTNKLQAWLGVFQEGIKTSVR